MGATEPEARPAVEPDQDDSAIVLEAIALMLKIETLTDEQRAHLKEIRALVDRRRQ
ncbi:MAG: hypothetical protein ABI838_01065 [Chloroflexota bacterium]